MMNQDECRFSKEHEWVWLDPEGKKVTVGISAYAAGELGDVVFVELPEVGRTVEAMEVMGTIEAVKTVADLYSPVAGEVTEVNAELESNPELVNESPHERGWMVRLEIGDRAQLEGLLSFEEYQAFIGAEA